MERGDYSIVIVYTVSPCVNNKYLPELSVYNTLSLLSQ